VNKVNDFVNFYFKKKIV